MKWKKSEFLTSASNLHMNGLYPLTSDNRVHIYVWYISYSGLKNIVKAQTMR